MALSVLATLLFSTSCFAATAQWEEYSDPAAESLAIWRAMPDGTRTLMLGGIPVAATSVEVEIPAECGTYFMTAVGNGMESEPSNTASWCPDPSVPPIEQPPVKVIRFNISGSIDIN